ncbi:MAG: hypothetical protein ABI652_01150 [Acidobacteriota bacterium]
MCPPLATPRRTAQAWVYTDRHLEAVSLNVGLSDGIWTQVLNGDLKAGDQVVTAARAGERK